MGKTIQITEATVKNLMVMLDEHSMEIMVTDPGSRLSLREMTEAQGRSLMEEIKKQRLDDPEFAEYYDTIQIWEQGGGDGDKFRFMAMDSDTHEHTARFIWDGASWDRLCV